MMHLMAVVRMTLRRNPMRWRRRFVGLFVVSADRVRDCDRLAKLGAGHHPLRRRFDQLATNQQPDC